jgi:hypothetical protein
MRGGGVLIIAVLGVVAVVGGHAAIARADDPPPEPAAPTSTGYPVEAAARPLLLPTGGMEGGVRLLIDRSDFNGESWTGGALEPRARYGFGAFEAEAAFALHLFQDVPDGIGVLEPERLRSVYLAGRYGWSPDATVGLALTVSEPSGDFSRYSPEVVVARKLHLSPGAAVELGAGAGMQFSSFDTGLETTTARSLLLEGQSRALAQVSRTVAAHATGRLQYVRVVSEAMEGFPQPAYLVFDVELGLVAALTPDIDVVAAIDIRATGDYQGKSMTLGLVIRRLP